MDDCRNFNIGKLNKVFTLLMISFPILSLYATPIPRISVADLILIIIYPILIIQLLKKNNSINKTISFSVFIFVLYIIVQFLITILVSNKMETYEVILNTLRYSFYLITLALFSKTFFQIQFAKIVLKKITIFTSIYLIIQFSLFSLFGYYLRGSIPNLRLQVDTLTEIYSRYIQGYYIRAHSIFAEPSHFAIYVLPYLMISLKGEKSKLAEYMPAIIISIAVLIAQSSTGIIMSILIWFMWYLERFFSKGISKKKIVFLLLSIIFIPVLLMIITKTNSFDFFLDRTFSSGSLGEAAYRRLGNEVIFNDLLNKSSYHLLFGQGMVNLQTYIPGLTRILIFFGISGLVLFLAMLIRLYIIGNRLQKEILIIFLILNIGTEILFGNFIFIYLPFLLVHDKR